jgi:hypothetical protein
MSSLAIRRLFVWVVGMTLVRDRVRSCLALTCSLIGVVQGRQRGIAEYGNVLLVTAIPLGLVFVGNLTAIGTKILPVSC